MSGQSGYLMLLVAVSIVNSAGQILMRWGGAQSVQHSAASASAGQWLWNSRWWLLGIAVGWVAGLGWAWCLRRLPVGVAVPLYAGLVYVLSVISAAQFLRERLTALQVLGIAAILVGILLVTLSSSTATSAPAGP